MAKKQENKVAEKKLVTEVYLDMRLGLVDKRFDGIDKRFDGIDKRLHSIDKRFDGIDKRFDGIDKRFDGIKIYIDEQLYETRRGLKEEITEEMRGETVKILQAVDGVMARFDRAEKEEAAHTALHTRITDTVHQHDERIGRLEARVTN
jgi:archaellum component FlaC